MYRISIASWALVAVAVTIWLAVDDWARTGLFRALHQSVPFLLPIVVVLIVGVVAYATDSGAVRGAFGLLTAVAVLGTIAYWVTYSYQVKREYLAAVETVDDHVPDYSARAAYPVAERQAKPNLGDVRGQIQRVRYVPDGDEDSFNALVTKPGFFTGYQVLEHGDIEPTGQGTATTCEFSDAATRRLGGHLAHSLDRAIASKAPGRFFSEEDVYGYCDGETPKVVVPLKTLRGFLYLTEVPAGVAIYDGTTGDVEIKTTVEDGDIPGPVFPQTIAAKLRSATEATGSFADYVFSRQGYDSTDGDKGDPNFGNTTEFNLRLADGDGGQYVTPLTAKGSAQTIVALSTISSTAVKAGTWNTLTVHRLSEVRKPGSTVAARIKGDYGDLQEWAAGMTIFEITPLSDGQWVASLGQAQDVSYRILVNADASSCLLRADGSEIRCGKPTADNAGTTGGTSTGSPAPVPASSAELEALSDNELAALQRQVTEEVLARMGTTE